MGPKVEAAVRFAAKTGRRAAIGSLDDITGIVAGKAGTNLAHASGGRVTQANRDGRRDSSGPVPEADGSVWHALSADRVLERRR